ncbi:MAG TPA: 50S ribosomal protein L15 [Ignavibacteriaceae bacterium]|uniref:Large ribosomal subunit protein uL15 n=3 Tax=environmental samples TaxID=1645731 RepID=A0A0H4TB81_9BACT|nr:50S ribosomal protein L15, large subunit ribosomal protein L15 [uncultured Ignavibacteria bacterium Rifle_16ft_4_minimus_38491]AKQ05419.1 50S ribosomal protein L15, large subunit ribosomal protein L15 [uncultured Ignavibacteria bacterium Rifle_16ft_4_minimus_32691]AKQ05469.1 50S ribosomal protein L15, large subunit ribosomal protein L15 [uncultured Ignavibacteria bacterium Rifle_16ft_4_minimus_332]
MDILSNLKYAKGSKKNPKRIGRGEGSGHGGTATKGMNGQLSRSGANKRFWFEGGQMPLQRRIPKYGFTHHSRVEYQVVNLQVLQKLADEKKFTSEVINPEMLKKLGLISTLNQLVKILGNGDIKAKLNFEVNGFSKTAKDKIETAGGTIKKI